MLALPKEERPRERLMTYGEDALSLSELLAIVLGTGTTEKSVIHLAEDLIMTFGGLKPLLGASTHELMAIPGIGPAKAIQLKATFALAQRYQRIVARPKEKITSPEDAYAIAKTHFIGATSEKLVCLLRNSRGALFHTETVFTGTLTEVLLHPRELFSMAIRRGAYSLIIAHNHPSGDPTPSNQDIDATDLLLASGRILGVRLDDHLIIGENYFSSLFNDKRIPYRKLY